MQSLATAPSTPATTRPPPVAHEKAALRAELDALNTELKELKSTDLGVRALAEGWLAFLGASVGTKLVADWYRLDNAKFAWPAIPVLVLALLFAIDAIRQFRKRSRLVAEENFGLARQRELRRLLGLDEARVPPNPIPATPLAE